jgi:hypothetical protein
MRLEITIGPPLLTINQGQTVLACEPDGRIQSGSDKGLFLFRYAGHQCLRSRRQRRVVQAAQCGTGVLLRVAIDAHQ